MPLEINIDKLKEVPNLLGEQLVMRSVITQSQLHDALVKQKEVRDYLGIILMGLGFVKSDEVILSVVSKQKNVKYMRLRCCAIPTDAIKLVSSDMAVKHKIMPVLFHNEKLTLAMENAFDQKTVEEMEDVLQVKIEPVLAGRNDIIDAIRRYYGVHILDSSLYPIS